MTNPLCVGASFDVLPWNMAHSLARFKGHDKIVTTCALELDRQSQRGARLARIRCNVRRCMLSLRAVSDTLRSQAS
jgi:hypothetical protein